MNRKIFEWKVSNEQNITFYEDIIMTLNAVVLMWKYITMNEFVLLLPTQSSNKNVMRSRKWESNETEPHNKSKKKQKTKKIKRTKKKKNKYREKQRWILPKRKLSTFILCNAVVVIIIVGSRKPSKIYRKGEFYEQFSACMHRFLTIFYSLLKKKNEMKAKKKNEKNNINDELEVRMLHS